MESLFHRFRLGFLVAFFAAQAGATDVEFEVASPIPILSGSESTYYSQTRGTPVPGTPGRFLLTTQDTDVRGTHGYRDLWMMESNDGVGWGAPHRIPSLTRREVGDGIERVIGDVSPKWHERSRHVLATGKTFSFLGGKKEDRSLERVAYATFNPVDNQWSDLMTVDLPLRDRDGQRIIAPNTGCVQRWDLDDGDILLPVRYRQEKLDAPYVTAVLRCGFDGKTLAYKEQGVVLKGPGNAPLFEPSLTRFRGEYFLTLRSERTAFVARSSDGLSFTPVVEWKYDDGSPVGSYNTQQHWVTHRDGLFLVYTRKGANNDHVFRHRAPLFMAQVDVERLCLIKHTERVVVPEEGADLGNFGVVNASPNETWIITSEMGLSQNRSGIRRVFLVKIHWTTPNSVFPLN
ncbi:MAG TPA: hypothetical protein PLN52_00440 [Opitutaceae bacterium]|nr:hypothetical protein [Opitutaceae bacterium]